MFSVCPNLNLQQLREVCALSLLVFVYGLSAACVWAQAESGQDLVRSHAVEIISDEVTIDGILDEAVWKSTSTIGDLIQREPKTGQAPSERTEVYLLRDANHLYIGIEAYDSEPDKMVGSNMTRDASTRSQDTLQIILDTFHDQRNAYYFATNPSGSLIDGLVYGNQNLNTDWNTIWDMRVKRTDQGWTMEVAIPFKSLNFPEGEETWGFNVSRKVFRKIEEDQWSGGRLETNFLQVDAAGEISNMNGIEQGIGLDVRPFLATSYLHTKATGEEDFDFEPGLDVFYNITPSLKLTGTINTDFGETEVDARQINLTRFSIRFPEKRSFFLEDVGVFSFSSFGPEPPPGVPDARANVFPFFSRRIGLVNGQEVPIDVGLKLTGKVGSADVGFLGVRTGDTDSVEGKNFMVGRFRQNFFERSYIGGIFTSGDPAAGEDSKTFGTDISLATSDFLGYRKNFIANAYVLKSDNEGIDSDDLSFGVSAHYPNQVWDGMLVFREIQENFDPGLGFVQRSNVRMYRGGISFNPRITDFLDIERMQHDVYYTRFDSLETGDLESSELYVSVLDWHFNSGDAIHSMFDYSGEKEVLIEPFEISPGVILQPGSYKMHRWKSNFSAASKRNLSGSITVEWGDFWSGSAENIRARLAYKIAPWFRIRTEMNQTFADLPEGKFTARILSSAFSFSVSPQLTFSNLVQYDNRSRNLGWQSRMQWTPKPGNDLFISLNQGWINQDTGSLRFTVADTKVAAKFQYTYRF